MKKSNTLQRKESMTNESHFTTHKETGFKFNWLTSSINRGTTTSSLLNLHFSFFSSPFCH